MSRLLRQKGGGKKKEGGRRKKQYLSKLLKPEDFTTTNQSVNYTENKRDRESQKRAVTPATHQSKPSTEEGEERREERLKQRKENRRNTETAKKKQRIDVSRKGHQCWKKRSNKGGGVKTTYEAHSVTRKQRKYGGVEKGIATGLSACVNPSATGHFDSCSLCFPYSKRNEAIADLRTVLHVKKSFAYPTTMYQRKTKGNRVNVLSSLVVLHTHTHTHTTQLLFFFCFAGLSDEEVSTPERKSKTKRRKPE